MRLTIGMAMAFCVFGASALDAEEPGLFACATSLRAPHFPPLARAARRSGEVRYAVSLEGGGAVKSIRRLEGDRIFDGSVGAAMRESRFRKECGGREVLLIVSFPISGPASDGYTRDDVDLVPPNRIVVTTQPSEVQP